MLDWLKENFEGAVVFTAWMHLVISPIIGAIIGWNFSESANIVWALLGLLIGFLVGLIIIINLFGLFAVIISMGRNTEYISDKLSILLEMNMGKGKENKVEEPKTILMTQARKVLSDEEKARRFAEFEF